MEQSRVEFLVSVVVASYTEIRFKYGIQAGYCHSEMVKDVFLDWYSWFKRRWNSLLRYFGEKPNTIPCGMTKFTNYLYSNHIKTGAPHHSGMWAAYAAVLTRTTIACEAFHSHLKVNFSAHTSINVCAQFTNFCQLLLRPIYIFFRSTICGSSLHASD